MPTVAMRDLSINTSRVVGEVERTGRPALVTRKGHLVVAIVPINSEAFEDYVLANAPEYVADMSAVDQALAEGTFTEHDLADVKKEIASMAAEAKRRGVTYDVVLAEHEAAEVSTD